MNLKKRKKEKGKAQLCSLENNSQIVTVNTGLKWCGLRTIFSHKTGSERRGKNVHFVISLTLGTFFLIFFSVFRNGSTFSTLSTPENTYLLIGTCWIATWACTHESLCLESRYSIFRWVQLSGCLYDTYVMGNGCSCTVWILETETVQTLVMIINNQQHSEELLHGVGLFGYESWLHLKKKRRKVCILFSYFLSHFHITFN